MTELTQHFSTFLEVASKAFLTLPVKSYDRISSVFHAACWTWHFHNFFPVQLLCINGTELEGQSSPSNFPPSEEGTEALLTPTAKTAVFFPMLIFTNCTDMEWGLQSWPTVEGSVGIYVPLFCKISIKSTPRNLGKWLWQKAQAAQFRIFCYGSRAANFAGSLRESGSTDKQNSVFPGLSFSLHHNPSAVQHAPG